MRRIPPSLIFCISLLSAVAHGASVTSAPVPFEWKGADFLGYLAVPAEAAEARPAILIVHDWMGPRSYFEEMARKIAERGYNAYVADVYGTETRPGNAQEAAQAAGKLRGGDRSELRARAGKNLEILQAQDGVDPSKVIAIGFCFGGTAVLEMARDGLDLAGVVSFHGNLESPRPATREGSVKPVVLVLHGDSDPYVPEGEVQDFQDEMRKVRADWEMVKFGGAVHSFTDPAADSPGARYDASAARRSWAIFWDFCEEIFGR
ncbi:MAG: dienelactone hydrolase family protein [Opitutales bacterium]|nr:dienelactone hydrolase family protein [Opitutales bacterium]